MRRAPRWTSRSGESRTILVSLAAIVAMLFVVTTMSPRLLRFNRTSPLASSVPVHPGPSGAGEEAPFLATAPSKSEFRAPIESAGGHDAGSGAAVLANAARPAVAAIEVIDFPGLHAQLRALPPAPYEPLEFEPREVLGVWVAGVARFRFEPGLLRASDGAGRLVAEGGWRLGSGDDLEARVRAGAPDGVWHHFDPATGCIVRVETWARGVRSAARSGLNALD